MDADVRLLLFSDPHLFASPQGRLRGVQTLPSLEQVLEHAMAHTDVDALVCCGDIVNDEPEGYAHFARVLERFGKPVYCIPGNHDDPVQLRAALSHPPFQVGGHVDVSNWRIVLLDSCVPGEARGAVSAEELQVLERALGGTDRHALICVHHQPVSMSSRWLDTIGISNADQLLSVIDEHPNVRALAWGHVHQYYDGQHGGVRLLATPSTGAQFLPRSDHFAIDQRPPAYRRLTLHANGTVDTDVVWVTKALGAAA
jgi:3',5'-cyclic-AMP phosphodiesterase